MVSCGGQSRSPRFSGTIETDEAHVASRYGGRVERIFASEGDSLTNGQIIVELEASELRAQCDLAAATLAELKAGARTEEIAAAKNEWQAIVAELEYARVEAKRTRDLFVNNAISGTERDRAVSRAAALEKSVAAAQSRYDLLLAGTRPERIAQGEAQLAVIETQLAETRVVAPTNCVLEILSVKIGDVLAPNREVATVLLTEHLWVRVYVPEPWLGHVHIGQKVRVRVDSFPDRDFTGTVEQISRSAEFTPRNVQTVAERIKQVFGIKVRLLNESGQLRAGMSADVYFPEAAEPGATVK
jgi:HlyD family secretion protein